MRLEMKEFTSMVRAMMGGDYPSFVVKNRQDALLPVFTYHKVNPDIFSAHLKFLRDNGYETLNIQELTYWKEQSRSLPKNKVMLTFDDGWDDLFTVVYPLLKSYSFKGVAFIAPYWLNTARVVTWQQVIEMHESGILDIQSHTFSHARVPVSSRVIGFYHPGLKGKWEAHVPFIFDHVPKPFDCLSVPLGNPIYEHDSGLSDSRRFLGAPELERRCLEFVASEGGESFFSRKNWRDQLLKLVRKHGDVVMRFESPGDQEKRMRDEISRAKEELEIRLKGKCVTALAYPYHVQGRMAARLLRETGHRVALGGVQPDCGFGNKDGEYQYLKRVNSDYITRLPGKGRKALWSLIWMKILRRMTEK